LAIKILAGAGNKDIGWGNIGLIGCPNHIKLALEILNSFARDAEKFQNLLEK